MQPDSITTLVSGSAPRNQLQVRHVPGRDIGQLEYQTRQRVNVPAVPYWHGPTQQDRDEEGRAQVDAWTRRRQEILDEAYARRRRLMAQAMEAEYLEAVARAGNPSGLLRTKTKISLTLPLTPTLKGNLREVKEGIL